MPSATFGDVGHWLDNYMLQMNTGVIVDELVEETMFLNELEGRLNSEDFYGDKAKILIKTSKGVTARQHREDKDVPYAKRSSWIEMEIPVREMIANTDVTFQSRRRARGGNASWGRIVDDRLGEVKEDLRLGAEVSLIGDGSGRLARITVTESTTKDGAKTTTTADPAPGGSLTIVCDNYYGDWGWNDVALIREGQDIEIWSDDGATQLIDVATVTKVVRGDYRQGVTGEKTVGYITATVSSTSAVHAALAENAVIYMPDSDPGDFSGATATPGEDTMPMGFAGICDTGLWVPTFQGLARSSYATLQQRRYRATDFGPSSESPSDGTPCSWDVSIVDDAIQDVAEGAGKGKVGLLACHPRLARAIGRRNAIAHNLTLVVNSPGEAMDAAATRTPKYYVTSDGRKIPFVTSYKLPDNMLRGLCVDDLHWFTDVPFGFVQERGMIWVPSPDRKLNYEARMYGCWQVGSERCDNHFTIEDMRSDI